MYHLFMYGANQKPRRQPGGEGGQKIPIFCLRGFWMAPMHKDLLLIRKFGRRKKAENK